MIATAARAGLAVLLLGAVPTAGGAASVAGMRGVSRILLIAAPEGDDARLVRQRRLLAGWRAGAAARDLRTVIVAGASVMGADDAAVELRRRYGLPARAFAAVLIGKDGRVALRSTTAVPPRNLEEAIDAMPMRRAEQARQRGAGGQR